MTLREKSLRIHHRAWSGASRCGPGGRKGSSRMVRGCASLFLGSVVLLHQAVVTLGGTVVLQTTGIVFRPCQWTYQRLVLALGYFQNDKWILQIPLSSSWSVPHTMKTLENKVFLASVNRFCAASNNRTGFLCDDRATCIPASQVCDRVSNCRSGEDEQEKLCGEWFCCDRPPRAGLPVVRQSSRCPSNPALHFWLLTWADKPGRSFVGQMLRDGTAQNPAGLQAPLIFLVLFFFLFF